MEEVSTTIMNARVVVSISVLIIVYIGFKTRLLSKILDSICSTSAYKKYFATLMSTMSKSSPNSPVYSIKKKMFSEIESKAKEIGGDVLEIGAGAGSSLELLTLSKESRLIALDYNPHMEKHFRKRLAQTSGIQLKEYLTQSAEDMSNIGESSLAVVFVADVMCSLKEDCLRRMLKEIKRVLKPGGCFYFMEHIIDKPGTWRKTCQQLISTQIGLWPRLFDGCYCDKDTWRFVQETGFKSVTLNKLYLPPFQSWNPVAKIFLFFIKSFLTGHAEK